MKVTYNWLKDFVNIKLSPEALAEKLTMAGIEVKAIEKKAGDFVFEIEITSNRPDWLSVIGIAREVAAITGQKLRLPQVTSCKLQVASHKAFGIKIEDKKDCSLYTAKIIKNVKVRPSPDWLRQRLESIGCRSINNIVDITNYVLFECGEPLHAFDLDQLNSDTIVVRRAKSNEKIKSIDEEERILSPDILVIADKERPVAIAGIMGGKGTEVTEKTKNILLEAAVFSPALIRRGRQRLGMQTDSAYRFERGVDVETAQQASLYAAQLIREIARGECVLAKSSGEPKTKPFAVELKAAFVSRVLGAQIAAAKVKKILTGLGFKAVLKAKNNFKVTVPAFRQDVRTEIDLVEEVARIYGYENIPTTLPSVKPQLSAQAVTDTVRQVKNILAGMGLNEAITYSLLDADLLKYFAPLASPVEIANPLSREQGVLRTTLIPGLAACVAYNLNQKQGQVNIFEIAKVFSSSGSAPKEELALGIALCGEKSLWFGQGHIQDQAGFLHLKGMLEAVFKRLGISGYKFMLQGNCAEVEVCVQDTRIGILKALERKILGRLDIKNKEVFVAEIALDKLFSFARINKAVRPPSRYPGVFRDISLVLKEDISLEKVMEVVKGRGGSLLEEVNLTDYYKGKPIPPGFKGLTISCHYCSRTRTLTETEVNPIHTGIVQGLKDALRVEIR